MRLVHQTAIYVNGKKRKRDSPQWRQSLFLLAEDKIGVFESLRSYGGKIFRLEEHLDRLFESAKTVGLELPKSRVELKRELTSSLAHYPDGDAFLRLAVDERDSYIWIGERRRPEWIYQKGVDLKATVIRQSLVNAQAPEPKSAAFFNHVLAAMEQKDADIYDFLFLDSNGYVTEGTIWNVFIVKGASILTPQVGILHGVTRQFVIECAEKENLPVIESNLTRHDLYNADEAFLTNTSGEIVPIRSLDRRRIGTRIPGGISERLMKRFRMELTKELGISHEN